MDPLQKLESPGDKWMRRMRVFRERRLQQPSARVEGRETVAGTGNQTEELGEGVEEVEGLGDE